MCQHVGATIRALREKQGISQAALADAAGIRQQTMYRTEKGEIRKPKAETLQRIASKLGVTMEKLLGPAPCPQTRTVTHKRRSVKREA